MSPAILYLLKSVACSGIFYLFYIIAFRNKPTHLWSRYYLLGTVLLSLVLPLIKIEVSVPADEENTAVIQLLNVVASNDTEPDEGAALVTTYDNISILPWLLYASVSVYLLFLVLKRVSVLLKLYRSSAKQNIDDIKVVMTNDETTPFSFFNIVFWNNRIDISSATGQRIFEHEKAHINHLHSVDRLLMNIVLIVCWCNPFYWFINKELMVVHEFTADEEAVADHNPAILSEMLLASAYPGYSFGMTSSFFNSSIKRRLTMLTTLKKSHAGRLGKWLVLPLMLIMLAGFTIYKKQVFTGPGDTLTVVIDAGHGGNRSGALAPDGTKEKDLNLAIAKKIKELNKNSRIRIMMTREADEDIPLRDRVDAARKMQADIFLSVHVNNDVSGKSGIQLMITKNNNEFSSRSQLFGTLLAKELEKVYTIDGPLRKGADKGVWVLDAPEINYPSLLIECGNLQNSDDLTFVKSPEGQENLAQHILSAIGQFGGTP